MSNADRKQIVFLAMIYGFVKEGYLPEIFAELSDNGLSFYASNGKLTQKERDKIKTYYDTVDKLVLDMSIAYSEQLILALLVALCEEILTFIKNEKKIAIWEAIMMEASSRFTTDNVSLLDDASIILDTLEKNSHYYLIN